MKPTTIVFIAFVAVPGFAHPVIVGGPTYAKNESPVIERRIAKPHIHIAKPHIHIPKPHIHIDGKKVLKGFETAGEVLGTIAAFFRRDLDGRALFDKGYELSARRSLPIDHDLDARELEERGGHHAEHTAVTTARVGLEVYDTVSNPNSKRDLGKAHEISARGLLNNDLQVRDFDDELDARDFGDRDFDLEARDFDDELDARDFDDELEVRDFDDDFLDIRALDETLDELD